MKDIKRLCRIAAGIVLVIAVACGIDAWNEAQAIKRETDRMPELWHILTFAEDKGAEWATDELLINNVDSFKKASLYKKWASRPTTQHLQRKIFGCYQTNFGLLSITMIQNGIAAYKSSFKQIVSSLPLKTSTSAAMPSKQPVTRSS